MMNPKNRRVQEMNGVFSGYDKKTYDSRDVLEKITAPRISEQC
jgi:hypothetical protein